MDNENSKRMPKKSEAFTAIGLMVAILTLGSAVMGLEIKVLLIISAACNILIARRCGYTFSDIEKTFARKISEMSGTLVVMIAIGFLIGTWMISGTAPALAYWLSKLISPSQILFFSFLLTTIMSGLIGSSFATMGTLGVVMFNTAIAQGTPAGMVAAAVICGSNFGQYFSPIADVTTFVAGLNKITIWEHLKQLRIPAILSAILSAIFYLIYGMKYSGGTATLESVHALCEDISVNFNIGIAAGIPLVIAILLCALKTAPAVSLFVSGFSAIIIAMVFQGASFVDCISAAWYGFDSSNMLNGEISSTLSVLVDRGGSISMADGILFILVAIFAMSVLETMGAFEVIQATLLKGVHTFRGLIITSSVFSALFTVVTCDSYTTNAVAATSLRGMYIKAGYNPKPIAALSISWAFLVEQILPWSFIAVYSASVYGVEVLDFVPGVVFFYFMAAITTIMFLLGKGKETVSSDFK